MKICHLTSVHQRNDVRIFIKQCNCCKQNGYDTHLVVADGGKNEIVNGILVHGVKKFKNRLFRMIFSVFAVFKSAINVNADIYILHDPELLFIGILLKILRKKVFFDSHECYQEAILNSHWIPAILRPYISKFYAFIEAKTLKCFDGVISATEHIAETCKLYNNNVIVLHNYPLLSEFSFSENFDKNNELKANYVLYFGGITINRGIFEMIKALELCNQNVKLLLCGNFEKQSLYEECKLMSGWSKVEYKGHCSRDIIKNLAKKCYCALNIFQPVIAHINAIPNKNFEYMALNLPIIVSNFELWKNLFSKFDCALFVDHKNPITLANAIDWIFDNPKIAKQMGENGRIAVENCFNFESESLQYINFLK